jgi:hypothetical protein
VLSPHYSLINKAVDVSYEVYSRLLDQRCLFLDLNAEKLILNLHMELLSEFFERVNIK